MSILPKKILVVDDSPTILMITKSVLEQAGYEVVLCEVSVELIGMLLEHQPDLTLLDVQMPYMTGDQLGLMVRPHTTSKLVLFSSIELEELKRLAESTGADGYIHKTGDFAGLVQSVKDYLGE